MVRKQRFPGFEHCMKLMRKHDPLLREEGFGLLLPYAQEYVQELIDAFEKETDYGLRCWILELIGEAKSEEAFPLLVEVLRGDDESLWSYAIWGLQALDTKEARQILYEARSYSKSSQEMTQYFRETLETNRFR